MTDTAAMLWGLLVAGVAALAARVAARPTPMFGRSPRRRRAGRDGAE